MANSISPWNYSNLALALNFGPGWTDNALGRTHPPPHTMEAMQQLDNILADATRAIAPVYLRLPIAESDPIPRERVYCYELYHQMRSRWPNDTPFVLSGEVDKQGHEIIRGLGARAASPDLLVHGPGNMGHNHAIIEVKPTRASRIGIEKDLVTLSQFKELVGYERAIYLLFGTPFRFARISSLAGHLGTSHGIELWHHAAVGQPVARVGILSETHG